MGTELPYNNNNNNNYYNGIGTERGPSPQSYIPYHHQPHSEVQNSPGISMRCYSQSSPCNNNWIPTSSSSSDNSSPSSSSMASGNYGPYRHQSNSHYYLQTFGQPKNSWEFMNHVQRQIHENYGYNANDIGTSTSTPSSSSISSIASSPPTNPGIAYQAQYSPAKTNGGGHHNYQGNPHQQPPNVHQHHYANSPNYQPQHKLQLTSGSWLKSIKLSIDVIN